MEKRLTVFLACLFLSVGMAIAQTKVAGTVVSQDGEPVVGATIRVLGTEIGAVTDLDGKFNLSCPEGKHRLRFSYVGMEAQELDAKSTMRVVLKDDAANLSEVVVTAMGVKRSAKALGYSATAVDGKEVSGMTSPTTS